MLWMRRQRVITFRSANRSRQWRKQFIQWLTRNSHLGWWPMANKKILIVDDDPDVRQAMNIRLKANSYDTCFASDALNSLSEARKHHPDLIILDLGLPGDDGYVVMERLKRQPVLSQIPII